MMAKPILSIDDRVRFPVDRGGGLVWVLTVTTAPTPIALMNG